jgi:hypothetical protein
MLTLHFFFSVDIQSVAATDQQTRDSLINSWVSALVVVLALR